MNKGKVAIKLYIYIFLVSILCVLLWGNFLPFESYGIDDTKILLNYKLDKYINYDLSEEEKGTLVQYQIKTTIEYGEEIVPIGQKGTTIHFGQIDGYYPSDVKLITMDIDEKVKNQYDETTGTLFVQSNSQKIEEEYFVIANYDTYIEDKAQRELKLNVITNAILQNDINRQISSEEQYLDQVTKNIGELTSVICQTQDIYNGYLKSNQINGTNYNTQWEQKEQIIISKKEAQETIQMLENNSFVKIHPKTKEEKIVTDLGNNQNLVYQSTQIKKAQLEELLGKQGKLEILDGQEKVVAIIDENTPAQENGIITITYEEPLESIFIKTSSIQKEGILTLKHTKEIKNTWTKFQNIGIKNTIKMEGMSNEWEIINELKEAKTTINLELDNNKWSNNRQNEVTFEIKLDANTIENNLFKNPSIQIEFPSQVEKVVLEESSIYYANGLELQTPYIHTNENGNLVMTVNLVGEQTQYDENSLDLITDIKIMANVILNKEVESTTQTLKVSFANEYTVDKTIEKINEELAIEIENYIENKQEEVEGNLEEETKYFPVETIHQNSGVVTSIHAEDLKLQVVPMKANTTLKQEDTVYEGEYIKYNIRIQNTSNEDMNHIKVVATIPEGVTYGELEADYNHYLGKYKYHFQEDITQKQIEIGTIKAGESIDTFYEVRVDDLLEEETKSIDSVINVYVAEQLAQSYSIMNKIEPAEVQLFMGVTLDYGGWSYYLNLKSDTNQEVPVDLHFLETYEIESVTYLDHIIDEYKFDGNSAQIVYTNYDNYEGEQIRKLDLQFSDNNIVTANLKTNSCYVFQGKFDDSKIKKKLEQSTVEITAHAEAKLQDRYYQSNENRIQLAYQNVKVSMTSPNEGEKVKYEETIEYEITIRNIGGNNVLEENYPEYVSVKVSDFLPEELDPISVSYDNWEVEIAEDIKTLNKKQVKKDISGKLTDEEGNKIPNINEYILIPRGETAILKIQAKAGVVFQETKIENSATIAGDDIDLKTTNVISHTILPVNYSEEEPDNPENPDNPDKPSNPDDSDNPNNPNEPSEPNDSNNPNNKYSIQGMAWIDENRDGKRSSEENVLTGMTVMLIDMANSSAIKDTTKTSQNGNYEFSNLEQGNYLILFKYDTNHYQLTEYQKSGVSSFENSDAIYKTITLLGEEVEVGITDVINLNASVTNIDIGLIENKICDFKIDKYINKVTVKTASGSKEYKYDNKKLVKTEIKAKEIEGATITIQYKIVITNVGEITGSIDKIVDYLPTEFSFSAIQNSSWSKNTNGQLVNTSVTNRDIKAGESIELTLTATKQMTANDTGTFTNKVELIGKVDNNLENNSDNADIIISVSTGGIVFITITIVTITILSILAIYLWKKGKIKIKNIRKMTFLFTFIIMTMITVLSHTSIAFDTNQVLVLHAEQTETEIRFCDSNHNSVAFCTGGTLPPANSAVKTKDENGVIHYGDANYYFWKLEEIAGSKRYIEPPISKGDFTLERENTAVNLKDLDDNYYLYGPLKYKSTANNGTYTCTVKDSDGNNITGFTISDASGTEEVTLKGGSRTFYLKIPKNKCTNGIGSVKLSVSASVIDKYKWAISYYAYYTPTGWDDCQNVRLRDPVEEFGEEDFPRTQSHDITWTDIRVWLKIYKIDKESNEKLPNVKFNVTCSSPEYDEDFTTNSNGEITIKNLPKGSYKIKEEENPNYGYTKKVADKTVNLNKGRKNSIRNKRK